MNEEIFSKIWNSLDDWNYKSKQLHVLGIDITRHDKQLYDLVIEMLSLYFNAVQIDLIVWSIFDDVKELPIAGDIIVIDNSVLCWEYVNKINKNENENETTDK